MADKARLCGGCWSRIKKKDINTEKKGPTPPSSAPRQYHPWEQWKQTQQRDPNGNIMMDANGYPIMTWAYDAQGQLIPLTVEERRVMRKMYNMPPDEPWEIAAAQQQQLQQQGQPQPQHPQQMQPNGQPQAHPQQHPQQIQMQPNGQPHPNGQQQFLSPYPNGQTPTSRPSQAGPNGPRLSQAGPGAGPRPHPQGQSHPQGHPNAHPQQQHPNGQQYPNQQPYNPQQPQNGQHPQQQQQQHPNGQPQHNPQPQPQPQAQAQGQQSQAPDDNISTAILTSAVPASDPGRPPLVRTGSLREDGVFIGSPVMSGMSSPGLSRQGSKKNVTFDIAVADDAPMAPPIDASPVVSSDAPPPPDLGDFNLAPASPAPITVKKNGGGDGGGGGSGGGGRDDLLAAIQKGKRLKKATPVATPPSETVSLTDNPSSMMDILAKRVGGMIPSARTSPTSKHRRLSDTEMDVEEDPTSHAFNKLKSDDSDDDWDDDADQEFMKNKKVLSAEEQYALKVRPVEEVLQTVDTTETLIVAEVAMKSSRPAPRLAAGMQMREKQEPVAPPPQIQGPDPLPGNNTGPSIGFISAPDWAM